MTKKEITSIPVLRILPEPKFIHEEDEEKVLVNKIREHTLRRERMHGAAVTHVDNLYDHTRLQDYVDSLRYHEKLMKQYGYDEMTKEFNYKLFPVPKSDKELDSIKKDIDGHKAKES